MSPRKHVFLVARASLESEWPVSDPRLSACRQGQTAPVLGQMLTWAGVTCGHVAPAPGWAGSVRLTEPCTLGHLDRLFHQAVPQRGDTSCKQTGSKTHNFTHHTSCQPRKAHRDTVQSEVRGLQHTETARP